MKKNTSSILKYLVEFLIVGFGVFLGIYVNERINQKKMEEKINTTMEYLISELETNKKNLEKAVAYRSILKEQVDSLRPTLSKKELATPYFTRYPLIGSEFKVWRGIGASNFETVAFDGAKISGITQEMEIDLLHTISQAYEWQELVEEIRMKAANNMIAANSQTRTDDIIRIYDLLTMDVLSSEKWLLNKLEVALNEIKTN